MGKNSRKQEQELARLRKELNELEQYRDQLITCYAIREHSQWTSSPREAMPKSRPNPYPIPGDIEYEETCTLYGSAPDYERWKGTFFYTHRMIACDYALSILAPRLVKMAEHEQKFRPWFSTPKDYIFRTYLAVIEAVTATSHGPRLMVADPYGSLTTDPVSFLTQKEAENLIGHVVSIRIGARYASKSHPVEKIFDTGYLKFE